MHHSSTILVPFHIGHLDLSITSPVMWTIVTSFVIMLFLYFASRSLSIIPKRMSQNILEAFIDFIENQIIKPTSLDAKTWTPLIFSVFIFVLFNDLVGIIPGATPATSNINETGALAVLIFLIGLGIRFSKKGLLGSIKSLIPEGVSWPMAIILFPIELISQLVKPFSLAIRLFANMSGGHLLLLTILGFTTLFSNIAISLVSVGGAMIILLFEIFVSCMQAYVFAFLSAILIGDSLADEH